MVYNGTYHVMQFCDGISWRAIGRKPSDATPDAYSFTDVVNAPAATLTESDIVQITGISEGTPVTITGDGTPNYRICADAICGMVVRNWTGASYTIESGQYLQLRLTSNAVFTSSYSATVTVGTLADTWSVSTAGQDTTPTAFPFTATNSAQISTVVTSVIVQVKSITGAVTTSIAGPGGPEYRVCADAACTTVVADWTDVAATIQNNQWLQLRMTASASYETLQTAAMTVGTVTQNWDVTTQDGTPNPFSFSDQAPVAQSTIIFSNIAQITGITGSIAVSITGAGASYRVCADNTCAVEIASWGNTPGTIQNNQWLQLRTTSAGAYGTAVTADITVGTATDNWSVSTAAQDTAPDAFSFTDVTNQALNSLIISNIVQINGITGSVATSVSGGGSPEYRICLDAACGSDVVPWTSAANTITDGQYIQLRLTSSAAASTAITATMTVGTGSDGWSVTTGAGSSFCSDAVGRAIGGYCWYQGGNGQSCDTNCTGRGGCNVTGIRDFAGSSGTLANCDLVLDTLYGAGTAADTSISGIGCGKNGASHIRDTVLTTCTQAPVPWGPTRACACFGDTTPNAFSFTDVTGQPLSSVVTSNIVQITGVDSAPTSISGGGSPEYRVCSDSSCGTVVTNWTNAAASVSNNYYIQLRLTSSASETTALAATMTVGGSNDVWSVTTLDQTPAAFSFTDQTGVALSTLTTSNIIQITGITGSVATSISGGGSPQYQICSDASCTGVVVNWTSAANTIQNNQYIQLRLTSSGSASTAVTATMTIGTGSDGWSVTTGAGCGGASVGGYCFYLGLAGESCDSACATHGGCNLSGTRNYVGYDGNGNANLPICDSVLDVILGPGDVFPDAMSGEIGCNVGTLRDWVGGFLTTCSANVPVLFPANTRRVCACNN